MVHCEILYLDSDNLLRVKNLRNVSTGGLVSGASVTAQVLDQSNMVVGGIPDPITLSAVVGRNGWYEGVIPDTADVSIGEIVKVKVVATVGALKRTWLFESVKVGA